MFLEKRQHLTSPQLAAENHTTRRINAMDLKNVLRKINTNSDNLCHSSPLKKAPLTGFHRTAKHIAAKAVSPSFETMRTI